MCTASRIVPGQTDIQLDLFLDYRNNLKFRKDNPNAVVKLLDAGHFALETNVDDIAVAIDQLLADAR